MRDVFQYMGKSFGKRVGGSWSPRRHRKIKHIRMDRRSWIVVSALALGLLIMMIFVVRHSLHEMDENPPHRHPRSFSPGTPEFRPLDR